MKTSLHKCSLTLRHIGHTRTNGFFNHVEALLKLTHASFHKVQMYVAYRYQHVTVSMHCLSRCVRLTVSFNKTPATVM